jgi:catechol 2,3-dioxygenase-like lactoylglutathione lyase family enzyme
MSTPIRFLELQHIKILVRDLDDASDFYREAFGFIEMHSHKDIRDPALSSWYGFGHDSDFSLDIRFMMLPEVLTLALVRLHYPDGRPHGPNPFDHTDRKSGGFQGFGVGPLPMVVEDIDEAYAHFKQIAHDYGQKHQIRLSSPPQRLSPIQPHQIGAGRHSAVRGQDKLLDRLSEAWTRRVNFHMVDPFGVHWAFCNAEM